MPSAWIVTVNLKDVGGPLGVPGRVRHSSACRMPPFCSSKCVVLWSLG